MYEGRGTGRHWQPGWGTERGFGTATYGAADGALSCARDVVVLSPN